VGLPSALWQQLGLQAGDRCAWRRARRSRAAGREDSTLAADGRAHRRPATPATLGALFGPMFGAVIGREGLIMFDTCNRRHQPPWAPRCGSVVWSLVKIVVVVLPLMGCVAYLTLWERKGSAGRRSARARTGSAPTAC
jgi:hypothetical protein